MDYWKTEVFYYWSSVWDPDSIPSSTWSNLRACFPLPRKVPSLSRYWTFLGWICQTLLLNLIQLSQKNPAFWLMHRGFTTYIKQVKTVLQWKTRVSFPLPLPYCTIPVSLLVSGENGEGTSNQVPRSKGMFHTATSYHQGSGV